MTALASRAAADVSLSEPIAVVELLCTLRELDMADQATALLARDLAASASLSNPSAVASLLRVLREAGAADQVATLLARDPAAHAGFNMSTYWTDVGPIGDGMNNLLTALREVGAGDQVAALTARLPAQGRFTQFLRQHENRNQYRYGLEADGAPAAP